MSEEWSAQDYAVVAAATAAGLAVGGYAAYFVYGRWLYDPQVSGERVLEANAPNLLAVWRYYQWWGECDKKAFRKGLMIGEEGLCLRD